MSGEPASFLWYDLETFGRDPRRARIAQVAAIRTAAGGDNLTTAAHAAGFADQAHFSRAFRRTFGAPPSHGL